MTRTVQFNSRFWLASPDPEDANLLILQPYLTGAEVRQDLLSRNLSPVIVNRLFEEVSLQLHDRVLSTRQEAGFSEEDVEDINILPVRFCYRWGENRVTCNSCVPVRIDGNLYVPRLPTVTGDICSLEFDQRAMIEFLTHLWDNPTRNLDYNRYGKRWEGEFYNYLFSFNNQGAVSSSDRIRKIKDYFMFGEKLREPRLCSPATLIEVKKHEDICDACGIKRVISCKFKELGILVGCECAVKLYLLSLVMPLIARVRLQFSREDMSRDDLMAIYEQLCYYEQQVAKHREHVQKRYSGDWRSYGCP